MGLTNKRAAALLPLALLQAFGIYVVIVSGCARPSSASLAEALATPATPEPTATATPTPEPTPTPTPTNTPTPIPPTSTPVPPTPTLTPVPTLRAIPEQVAQGGVVLFEVASGPGTRLTGTFEGRSLSFASGGLGQWALIPIGGNAAPGPRTVAIETAAGQLRTSFQVVAGSFEFEDIDVSNSPSATTALNASADEEAMLAGIYRAAATPKLWTQTFTAPSQAPISSPFGVRRSYNGVFSGSFHMGTDFALYTGDPVYAANKGRVVLSRLLVTRGNEVIIDHGLGVYTGYSHLSALRVEEGQEVERGQLIGLVGATGLVTGPHLHWELRVLGVAVDPMTAVGGYLGPRQ